jgi:phage terminase large subunit-like protein
VITITPAGADREQSKTGIVATSAEAQALFWSRYNAPEQLEWLKFHWGFWGRPGQFPPVGDWSHWLIFAGRGFGKTRTGAEWVTDAHLVRSRAREMG